MLLGLDDFKAVNSRLGHDGGDSVLKGLTPLLEEKLRGSDTVARLGGDQFGLIVENLQSDEDVLIVAGRILGAVSAFITSFGALSASLGIAIADRLERRRAARERHTAMHEAKRSNRGGLELFGAQIPMLHAESPAPARSA